MMADPGERFKTTKDLTMAEKGPYVLFEFSVSFLRAPIGALKLADDVGRVPSHHERVRNGYDYRQLLPEKGRQR